MPDFTLETSHGILSITDTGLKNSAPTLLLLHDNSSSSSKIFRSFFTSPLADRHRIITFDLPGHGASSNAPTPQTTYTMSGYAACAVHVLEHLNIETVVLIGWGLGGGVAISMIPELNRASERGCKKCNIAGIVLTGASPALGAEQCARAFKVPTSLSASLSTDKVSTDKDADDGSRSHSNAENTTAGATADENQQNPFAAVHWPPSLAETVSRSLTSNDNPHLFEPWILADAIRTDGRARSILFHSLMGGRDPDGKFGVDQVSIIETEEVPIAVVNGGEDPFVEGGYFEGLGWRALWRGKGVRLERCGHAPFWEDWGRYEEVVGEFLGDVATKAES